MPHLRFSVAVVIERVPLANRWASEQWRVAAVEADAGSPESPSRQSDAAGGTRWRFPGQFIELHRSESEGYYLNITSPEPKAFVMWRLAETGGAGDDVAPRARPHLVTVSYNEAGRLLDGGEQVDAVPLPAEIRAWMEPFVAEHYRPEPKRKVRRNDLYERDRSGGAPEPKVGR